jgi:hypothetical protein
MFNGICAGELDNDEILVWNSFIGPVGVIILLAGLFIYLLQMFHTIIILMLYFSILLHSYLIICMYKVAPETVIVHAYNYSSL